MGTPTFEEVGIALKQSQSADHLCCIYETEEERWASIAAFVAQGLAQNEKVIYVADNRPVENTLKYLRDEGVMVDRYHKRGQLSILSAQEVYVQQQTFNPSKVFTLLENEISRALKEGFSGLRGTGEMSWVLKRPSGSERLMEYEAKLNEFLSGSSIKTLCQYDKRRFEAGILLDVIRTHPILIIGSEVFDDNFYFLSPHDFLSSNVEALRLDNCLKYLADNKGKEWALQETEKRYRDLVDNANSIILRWNAKGQILFMNPYGLDFFGYTEKEIIGRNVVGSVVPEKESITNRDLVLLMKDIQKNPDKYKDNENENMRKDGSRVWVVWTNKAIRMEGGDALEILSVGNDITKRKEAEQEIEKRATQLRKLNRQLRKELQKSRKLENVLMEREKVLEIKSQSLEETNIALKVLLEKREKDKDTLGDTVLNNMKELVRPFVTKLKHSNLDANQRACLEILEKNLAQLLSRYSERLSAKYSELTPTEIMVANLVKDGNSTKEIAELLGSSIRTIDFHRKRLRKKLGITNEKINLRTYLLSLKE